MVGDSDEAIDQAPIERLRDRHLGRLLLRAHRDFSARAIAKLRQRGFEGLTLAHLSLLPHLEAGGTRVTTLAERAGMTKQGMGQLIADLERQGFVVREPDPTDRRAALIRYTEPGHRLLRDAVAVTGELEAEYADLLGNDRLAALRAALMTLAAGDDL